MIFLLLLSGICWTIVYIQLISTGLKEKVYGMPFIAIALNFAWEAIHSFLGLKNNLFSIETWIILVWFILDIIIVYTYLRYGKHYFPKHTNKEYFMPWTVLIFFMSFIIQYYFVVEFGDLGRVYSRFLQNLIMSILFINMLVTRNNLKGQNLIIGINKWIGTLAPTILYGVIYQYKLILVLGLFCSLFDLLYIYFFNNLRKITLTYSNIHSTTK
ncbi:hypothetical protein [Clostridium sp. C2-6-12]|uniref:transmembrane-type terpene cyclase n=1 Tax=Clostridium sp. C2-6-12 TaxID=2698832 RepID=UPI00137093B8|nr:hypothetical protein [Clostridium sp. C2-6-12]